MKMQLSYKINILLFFLLTTHYCFAGRESHGLLPEDICQNESQNGYWEALVFVSIGENYISATYENSNQGVIETFKCQKNFSNTNDNLITICFNKKNTLQVELKEINKKTLKSFLIDLSNNEIIKSYNCQ